MLRLSLATLLPVVLAVAACAGPVGESEEGSATTSNALVQGGDYSACSLTRSAILASTSTARRETIARGFAWLDANVPYSQTASHEGYRTDCSGFLSMCWETGTSYDTATFMAGGAPASQLASYDDMIPGDGVVRSGHAALFLGWEDAGHTSACIIEMASTASDMQFRARKTSVLQSSGSKPFRLDRLANDLGQPPANGGGGTKPPPSEETPPGPGEIPSSQNPPSDDDESSNEGTQSPSSPKNDGATQSPGDPGDESEEGNAGAKPKKPKSSRLPSSEMASSGCSMTAPASHRIDAGLGFITIAVAFCSIIRRRRERGGRSA